MPAGEKHAECDRIYGFIINHLFKVDIVHCLHRVTMLEDSIKLICHQIQMKGMTEQKSPQDFLIFHIRVIAAVRANTKAVNIMECFLLEIFCASDKCHKCDQ